MTEETAVVGSAASATPDSSTRVAYDGVMSRVLAIALKNALFNLLTLGFYRFWGKTRLRRYFWGSVSLYGDRVEYTGRATELLLGFVIAIVILGIFLFASALAIEMAGRGTPAGDGMESLQALLVFLLIYIAIFRARRYRLTRTHWRGIRGGQTGSTIGFAFRALGWTIVLGLTLGLAYPVFRTRLTQYQMENTWFGSQCFRFDARAGALFGRWFLAWLFLIPTLGLTYVWYRVQEYRYFVSQTRFRPLRFDSDLPTGRIIGLVVLYLGVIVLASIAFLAAAISIATVAGNGADLGAQGEDAMLLQMQLAAQQPALIVLLLLYLVVVGLIRTAVFLHPMIARLCNSLSVTGEMDFEELAQSSLEMPSRGEGLADALDVGSI
jgi:uncharacterized membrane protein YjgN (DUF898 family)